MPIHSIFQSKCTFIWAYSNHLQAIVRKSYIHIWLIEILRLICFCRKISKCYDHKWEMQVYLNRFVINTIKFRNWFMFFNVYVYWIIFSQWSLIQGYFLKMSSQLTEVEISTGPPPRYVCWWEYIFLVTRKNNLYHLQIFFFI